MTNHSNNSETIKAVLVAVQLPGVSDDDHQASLSELQRLVETLGHQVHRVFSQKRPKLEAAAVVGEGKVLEIRDALNHDAATPTAQRKRNEPTEDEDVQGEVPFILVFDHDLTPTQTRNLKNQTGATILDRTAVILEIFFRHAKTREARLQVEIARLIYLTPRVRESGSSDRQRGGIGGRGVGETAHELDRRRIRDRISQLKKELETIHKDQNVRRQGRQGQARVALVGYTNAGKSSLMRLLTGTEVLVADKLFATLDTTVRSLQPEGPLRILVSDTVGFIKKLPHDLVASFRSTLDEALDASLLLFVVDASDPTFRSQLKLTQEVLGELGADQASRLILNKWDLVAPEIRKSLEREFRDAITVSTKIPGDIDRVRSMIFEFFEQDWEDAELLVPYSKPHLVQELRNATRILSETSSDEGYCFKVKGKPEQLARLRNELTAHLDSNGGHND